MARDHRHPRDPRPRAYFHVDQDIIGDVVRRDVPAIRDDLKTIIDSLDPD